VYVTDIARANVLAATAAVSDRVYNIATGVETSLVELARALLAAMGSDLEVEFGPDRDVPAVERRLATTERAANDLGFTAQVGLADGLARLVAWWRARRA
jgi:UDP-glucose 4-epimerase